MTDAELVALCRRHGIGADEGRDVLKLVVAKLTPSRPDGIGLPGDAVGSVVEITAHLNDIIWETRPFNGGESYASAERVVEMLKGLANS